MNNYSSNKRQQEYGCKATNILNRATNTTNGGVILPIEEQDNNVKNAQKYTAFLNLFFEKHLLGAVGSCKSLFVIDLFSIVTHVLLVDCDILQRICGTLISTLLYFSLYALTRNRNSFGFLCF